MMAGWYEVEEVTDIERLTEFRSVAADASIPVKKKRKRLEFLSRYFETPGLGVKLRTALLNVPSDLHSFETDMFVAERMIERNSVNDS